MNAFEFASKNKLRFNTERGALTSEDLWDLPLVSAKGPSLDKVATETNEALLALGKKSFVKSKSTPDPQERVLEVKLEVLKHIIQAKEAEQEARANENHKREQVRRLREALAEKQEANLKSLSEEDLLAKLKELEG